MTVDPQLARDRAQAVADTGDAMNAAARALIDACWTDEVDDGTGSNAVFNAALAINAAASKGGIRPDVTAHAIAAALGTIQAEMIASRTAAFGQKARLCKAPSLHGAQDSSSSSRTASVPASARAAPSFPPPEPVTESLDQ